MSDDKTINTSLPKYFPFVAQTSFGNSLPSFLLPQNSKYCGIPTGTSGDTIVDDYTPSERNLFLGMIQCFANQLKQLASRDTASSTALDLIQTYDDLLSSQKICFCSVIMQEESTFWI